MSARRANPSSVRKTQKAPEHTMSYLQTPSGVLSVMKMGGADGGLSIISLHGGVAWPLHWGYAHAPQSDFLYDADGTCYKSTAQGLARLSSMSLASKIADVKNPQLVLCENYIYILRGESLWARWSPHLRGRLEFGPFGHVTGGTWGRTAAGQLEWVSTDPLHRRHMVLNYDGVTWTTFTFAIDEPRGKILLDEDDDVAHTLPDHLFLVQLALPYCLLRDADDTLSLYFLDKEPVEYKQHTGQPLELTALHYLESHEDSVLLKCRGGDGVLPVDLHMPEREQAVKRFKESGGKD